MNRMSAFAMCSALGLPLAAAPPVWPVNQDEAKVPAYELPELLEAADGTIIASAEEWMDKRRPELLRCFEEGMYGRAPERHAVVSEVLEESVPALDGKARRKQVRVYFGGKKEGPGKPRPKQPGEFARGTQADRWQIERVLSQGYGTAAAWYEEIDPDYDDGFENGVHALFPDVEANRDGATWGSGAAWAWGLRVGMDYLETDRWCAGGDLKAG